LTAEATFERVSRTKGREATLGVIPGRFALAVGRPNLPAPRDWSWTPLSSVAQLESGHTPSRKHPDYWDGGIPWVSIKDAVDNHGRTIDDTCQHVSQLGLDNSSARLLPPRTVCLSRTASVGYVVAMGREMATSQDFVNWVCGPRLEPDYLKYVLLAERESLLRFASGTTHQTIYYPEAKAFHVLLPPPAEQGRIANVLRALDAKIDVNRRMNETLETDGGALFKSWFVDFDPVHSKATGKQPFGMDDGTAALFPKTFRASDLGSIPNSWQVSSVRAECEAVYDGPHATPAPSPVGPVFLGIRNLTPRGLDLSETRRLSEDDWPRWTKRVVPSAGDIVFSYEATLGYFAILPRGLRCCLGRRLALVRPLRGPYNGHYLFHYFVSAPFQGYLKQHASVGATVDRILIADFPEYPVLLPSPQLVAAFEDRASAWWATIHSRSAESYALATLRDCLIPKLLSGELRVKDAEALVGEAT